MDEEQKKHSEEEVESSEAGIVKDADIRIKAKARSYECMFCKRGFTTAQALGGHMNIHRRDRPDRVSKSSSSSSSKRAVDISCGPYRPYHAHKRSGSISNIGGSASSAPVSGFYADTRRVTSGSVNLSNVCSTRELSLLKSDDDGLMMPGNDAEGGEAEGDDLDLELRLGHSHSL